MKYIHLFETPHRFEEPESTSVGKYPAHMAAALQFGKFIEQMGDRVHVSTKSGHARFNISKEQYRVDKSDTKLVNAMRKWQEYDKIYPLNVMYFASPVSAYFYAKRVLKREWPEAEPYIMKKPYAACTYAKDVMKREWPEAEPYIMKNSMYACLYATYVRKRRWPEAEPYIMESPGWWKIYKKMFNMP